MEREAREKYVSEDLIGSVANNVAVFALSFASESQQQTGWRSASAGE